jgi:hypothetical protein
MCEMVEMSQWTRYVYQPGTNQKGYYSVNGMWVHQCQQCRKYFESSKVSGVKYGSAKCRVAASRAKNKGSKRHGHCEKCGADIMTGHVHFGTVRKYCSDACRQKAYRDSKKSLV